MKKVFACFLLCLITITPLAQASKEANDYIAAANKLAIEKKYKESILKYKKALELDPKNSRINLMLGLAYANTGAMDDALNYVRIASQKEPSYTTFYNLGLIHGARKETESSVEAFNKALSYNPDSANAHYRKGLVYSQANAHQEAISAFEKALKLNPQLDEARVGLVGAYLKLDNRAAAMDQIEEFRKMKKDDFASILEARIKENGKAPKR